MPLRPPSGYIRPGYEPLKVTNPPTGASATAGTSSASVSFTAPTNTGGGAPTNYYAVSNPGQFTGSSVTSPITVSGLTNGTAYTFKVWAENLYGPSAYSDSTGSVTPQNLYVEDVFSTYLYTGNSTTGGTQTITNNIDLSTKGGMVWIKGRSAASNHILTDTTRGAGASATNNNALASNLDTAEDLGGSSYDYLSSFSTTGFVVTQGGTTTATRGTNYNNVTYTSWTFREQAKFFDVVTFTQTSGTGYITVNHNLGSTPGCIMVKRTDATGDWYVYHRSLGTSKTIYLNYTDAAQTASDFPSVTSTSFQFTNFDNGAQFVAYLFAHDAGGFGLSGSENVISCGSYTGNGSSTGPTITLGYEPQWLMIKNASGTGNWNMIDNMRGMPVGSADAFLEANTSDAEATANWVSPTATGFNIVSTSSEVNTNASTYIYIAIRRGPMKTPTSGTSVYNASLLTGNKTARSVTGIGFPPDLVVSRGRNTSGYEAAFFDRLRGAGAYIITPGTNAENVDASTLSSFDQNGFSLGTDGVGNVNDTGIDYVDWCMRRAPGFFDEVCYTGDGVNSRMVTHNLGVAPEFLIIKRRDAADNWSVAGKIDGGFKIDAFLNTTAAFAGGPPLDLSAEITSTAFQPQVVGNYARGLNTSGGTYVAYLFATCAGVSKVGSYTGSGTTKQIDCGFTGGARFVLIKRTDDVGDWYVWDSARGIVSGNDPYLLLNSTAAEVTNTDYVDTYSAGFEISSTAPAAINANGETFIYLAIA